MNGKARIAWELYLKMETSGESFSLLQLIANDCYKVLTSIFHLGIRIFLISFRKIRIAGFETLDKAAALGLETATPLTDPRQYINSNLGFSNLKI